MGSSPLVREVEGRRWSRIADSGASAVEYGLLIAVMVATVTVTLTLFSGIVIGAVERFITAMGAE